jgi:hypothetical protein
MKQTAVEWLVNELYKNDNSYSMKIIEQAKEIEKQQQGYSEEEVLNLFVGILDDNKCFVTFKDIKEWFEQNKNK